MSPLIIIAGGKAITLENQLKVYCEIKTYNSSSFPWFIFDSGWFIIQSETGI